MDLQKLKDAVSLVTAFIAEHSQPDNEGFQIERKPLPADARSPYDACRQLWEAATIATRQNVPGHPNFNAFDYIIGIQAGRPFYSGPDRTAEMNAAIIALGNSPWGQAWLNRPENGSQIDVDYQRHFLGFVWVRVNQNDETQGYRKVP